MMREVLPQRQKILNLLRIHHPRGMRTEEMISKFREMGNDASNIKNIRVEVLRRNLQELLAMGLIRKEGTGQFYQSRPGQAGPYEIPIWFAVIK